MKGLRISIRLKMLLVITVVLLLAMGSYLYLATTLFTRDKLAYVYDLNASLVDTLSEQIRSSFEDLQEVLAILARDVLRPDISPEQREQIAQEILARKPDLLRVEIYASDGHELSRQHVFVSPRALERHGIGIHDLGEIRRLRPLPVEAIAAAKDDIFVQNASLPPSAAIVTVAFSLPAPGRPVVITADISHERLLRIIGRSKLHETFVVDERGEVLAHPNGLKVIQRTNLAKHALVQQALAAKLDRGAREVVADGEAMLGAYARVGVGRLTVLTQIPKKEALRASQELIQRSVLFAGVILVAAFLASLLFSRLLTSPVRRLRVATEVIGRGNFDIEVDVRSRDEIGDLARSFNQMARVLKETQAQLIQSEKMAAFGQLGAGITHEVKNPMTGIVGFAQIGQKKTDKPDKALELFSMIEREAVRCNEILVNFLKFARGDPHKMEEIDLNRVVEEASKVFGHTLSIHMVKLDMQLGEGLPTIQGNAGQLQQVLLNLAMNAQQAMPDGGRVEICTSKDGEGSAVITVSDDGPGMPEDVRKRTFEPFFTTKASGEGTGLGLAISYGIIRDHRGKISVESSLGKGTRFTMRFPAANALEPTQEADAERASG